MSITYHGFVIGQNGNKGHDYNEYSLQYRKVHFPLDDNAARKIVCDETAKGSKYNHAKVQVIAFKTIPEKHQEECIEIRKDIIEASNVKIVYRDEVSNFGVSCVVSCDDLDNLVNKFNTILNANDYISKRLEKDSDYEPGNSSESSYDDYSSVADDFGSDEEEQYGHPEDNDTFSTNENVNSDLTTDNIIIDGNESITITDNKVNDNIITIDDEADDDIIIIEDNKIDNIPTTIDNNTNIKTEEGSSKSYDPQRKLKRRFIIDDSQDSDDEFEIIRNLMGMKKRKREDSEDECPAKRTRLQTKNSKIQ